MCLSKEFYDVLVEILHDTQQVAAGASRLETDRAIARQFNVSTETARNWRRGMNKVVSPAVSASIIQICEKLSPRHVPTLEFIRNTSGDVQKVKLAAESVVEDITAQVLTPRSSWQMYSGPLMLAHNQRLERTHSLSLAYRSNLIVKRVLELGIERDNIPCIGELIRYSVHSWFSNGFLDIRWASLSDKRIGVLGEPISAVEKALYLGDGCAAPSILRGRFDDARFYCSEALHLLDGAGPADERYASMSVDDARLLIRAIQALAFCYYGAIHGAPLFSRFLADYETSQADSEWAESIKYKALGYIELVRGADPHKAAYAFERASYFSDQWLSHFGIAFSSTSFQSLSGFASMLAQGPSDSVRSQISEGLLRAMEPGFVHFEIQARICQAQLYQATSDDSKATYHWQRSEELAEKHHLLPWYASMKRILRLSDRKGN